MRFLCLLICGLAFHLAESNSVVPVANGLAISKRFAASPLLNKANLVHRLKRQALRLGPREPAQCALECMETMTEKLTEQFPEVSNGMEHHTNIKRTGDYDPETFDKFCGIYTPGSRCLHQCPESQIKKMAMKGFAMLEFMCIERYDDFKKHGQCMNDTNAEIEQACNKTCSEHEKAIQKLEDMTSGDDINMDYDDIENLVDLMGESCMYTSCMTTCDSPILAKRCGEEAAQLERDTIRVTFQSLGDLFAFIGGRTQWPEACAKLAQNNDAGATTDE